MRGVLPDPGGERQRVNAAHADRQGTNGGSHPIGVNLQSQPGTLVPLGEFQAARPGIENENTQKGHLLSNP
jgi:hypothetical protein